MEATDDIKLCLTNPQHDWEKAKFKEAKRVLERHIPLANEINNGKALSPNVFITSPHKLIVDKAIHITIPVGIIEGEHFERMGLTVSSLLENDPIRSYKRALYVAFMLEDLIIYDKFPLFPALSFERYY